MQDLYHEVVDSDVLVLGAPTYWFNMAAQLKTFIDRLYALPSGSLHGKSIVYITTFGDSDEKVSGAYNGINALQDTADYCGANSMRYMLPLKRWTWKKMKRLRLRHMKRVKN